MLATLRRRRAATDRTPRIGAAVGRFVLGSVAAIAVVVVGGYFALRPIAIDEAARGTRDLAVVDGQLLEATGIDDGVLRGDPDALAALDEVVVTRILTSSIVRVKLWSSDGTILYSDEPALIGERFGLGEEERQLLRTGGADAELSDLDSPENRFERQEGKLLEAHTAVRTQNGTQVLFEIYQRFSSVSGNAQRLLRALGPPLLGGVLVLLLVQVPLAVSLARRVQRGHREREELLASAIEASDLERRRIASDLHDGVVQDLAGVAFGLAPLAADAEARGAPQDAEVLHDATSRLRQGVRDLRTLLVEIHPPSLASTGLEAALHDLLSPLAAKGIATELHVDHAADAGSNEDALVYRVAREALRNVDSHARAGTVRVDVTRPEPRVTRLVVADDGQGFSTEDRAARATNGHVGLTLLEGLVRRSDGTLDVRSEPGRGTTVELRVPVR